MSILPILGLSTPPQGKKSLATQLSYTFVVTLIILFVISSIITTAYVSVLEKERAESMQAVALSCGLNLSGTTIGEGMNYPLPSYEYAKDKPYIVNIYLSAGNTFVRVYSSEFENKSDGEDQSLFFLDNVGSEYKKSFDQMTVELSSRSESDISYQTAVAPIVGSAGASSGIIEVMMPEKDFHGTVNGFSLSWVFTIFSISLSITIVYYQMHKMLRTVFSKPDMDLPKVIRYGLSACESIAFFSAMALVIPPLIIPRFLIGSGFFAEYPEFVVQIMIASSLVLFSVGFFGFRSIRVRLFNRLTARVTLVLSVVVSFVLLLINGIFSNPVVFVLLQMPIAFGLGMMFYFQREYRMYAGRLGHKGFDIKTIHSKQFTNLLLGSAVGAVMAGMIYDRFGLLAVLLICGAALFIVAIITLLFVQHCPSSNEPAIHFSTFLYALSNRKSGAFLWSTVVSAGMMLSFFIGFLPNYLGSVGISLATVSFYYMLFALFCCVIIRIILTLANIRLRVVSTVWVSSLLQLIGYLLFALLPTAKVLVIAVALFGMAMGLHEFKFLDYYATLIREEKRSIAGIIFERSFANGVAVAVIPLSISLMFSSARIPLLIYCLICAAVVLAYPVMNLIHVPSADVDRPMIGDPFVEATPDWESENEYDETEEYYGPFLHDRNHESPWEDENDVLPYYPDESDSFDSDQYEGGKWV